ncbi:hypothetical protein D3C72_1518130 [compost metagenome]
MVGVAQQDAALVQRPAVLLPLQRGVDGFDPARAWGVRIRRLADLRAHGKIGVDGFVLERFHGVCQMRPMPVRHRQRKRRAVRKTGGDAMPQE